MGINNKLVRDLPITNFRKLWISTINLDFQVTYNRGDDFKAKHSWEERGSRRKIYLWDISGNLEGLD